MAPSPFQSWRPFESRDHLDGLDDEIRDHLDRDTQDHIDRGMTPEAARAAARRKFGSVALTKEDARAVWVPVWVDQLLQDVRYGFRLLRRSPGFSAVVIVTLALGIGMNTAVFSVVNAVLLRPLSFPHPERVLWMTMLNARIKDELVTAQDVLSWRDAVSLERLVAYDEFDGRLTASGLVAPARIATVSGTSGSWPAPGRRSDTCPRRANQKCCCRMRSSSIGSARTRLSLATRWWSANVGPPWPACCRLAFMWTWRHPLRGPV